MGTFHTLRAGSSRFRRLWFDPRVRTVIALVAFAAAGLYAKNGQVGAVFPAFFGVLFAVGAAVESYKRGSLLTNRFVHLLAGVGGLGFVAFAGYLRATYPFFGVTVIAATSAITGLALLAWAILMTTRG
ncbi:hypothetical protein [Halorussus pelagicus]|uniref:hypothetical protein n=1 Tax=Halorussus pelagicus TaxID=2505977 RepID=UPI000FFC2810|nr:hypothetical protein [Halorussus pelagicus]